MRARRSADRFATAFQQQGCTAGPCSLVLPPKMPIKDWAAVGRSIGTVEQAVQFWIGDWWTHGKFAYGERKAIVEAEDWSGPAWHTCMNAGTVARAFAEMSRRRELLSFKHHGLVAALPPDQADQLLDRCEETIATIGRPRSTIWLQAELQLLRQRTVATFVRPRYADAETVVVRVVPAQRVERTFALVASPRPPDKFALIEAIIGDALHEAVAASDREDAATIRRLADAVGEARQLVGADELLQAQMERVRLERMATALRKAGYAVIRPEPERDHQ